MATTTENLGLTLPAGTDRAEISVLNENFQTLDTFAGQATADIQEVQETANAAAPQATTYTKDEVDAAIEEAIEHGGGGTTDYDELTNKPSINGVSLTGNKTTSDLGIVGNVQADWTQTDDSADDYIKNKPTIPTVNDAALTIQKNGTAVGTFSANAATAATINITVPVDASDVDALPDTTKYGSSLALSIDSSTYVVTAVLKDQDGNTLGTVQTIDLPLETVVVGGSYDDTTKKVILTLKNGNTIDFSIADLVSGLQTEITSTNKLDADLVDDTTSVHKFVTAADKANWNAKSDFSGSYNDLTDKPTIPAPVTVDQTYNAASVNAQAGTAVAQAIGTKVDKVTGKGLSTNDFTNADKTKLDGIESGAEANVQADWTQTDTTADDYIKNKPTIPTPVTVDQTYSATSANAQSGVAVAQAISTKVDKVTGKGLSTNDFTDADKSNLAAALATANAAAPQSTTYTKTEVDTALNNKLDANAVSAAGSSTTSGWADCRMYNGKIQYYNTVSSGGITAPAYTSEGGTGRTSLTENAILAGNGSSGYQCKLVSTSSGALYATSSGGAASFGTLPIAQGGTGSTTASEARTNLGLGSAATYAGGGSISSGNAALVTGGTVYSVLGGYALKYVTNVSASGSATLSDVGLSYTLTGGHVYRITGSLLYNNKSPREIQVIVGSLVGASATSDSDVPCLSATCIFYDTSNKEVTIKGRWSATSNNRAILVVEQLS